MNPAICELVEKKSMYAELAEHCMRLEAELSEYKKAPPVGYFAIFKFNDKALQQFKSVEEYKKMSEVCRNGYWWEPLFLHPDRVVSLEALRAILNTK